MSRLTCSQGHRTLWPSRCPHCLVKAREKQQFTAKLSKAEAQHRAFLARHNARQQAQRQAAHGWMEGLA